MGGGLIGGLFSVLTGGGETPKADAAPAQAEVKTEADSAKKARAALIENMGGIAGEELDVGQVKKRDNVFGN